MDEAVVSNSQYSSQALSSPHKYKAACSPAWARRIDHLKNSILYTFRFCESLSVKVVIPIRLPRSSNRSPLLDPADIGALTWMYSVLSSAVLRPDSRPDPDVLTNPLGDPIV